MAATWAQSFYGSIQLKKCRKGFISYKRGLCERCLSRGLIVPGNHVHHKERLTPENINRPEVALNWNNLELLCEKCHEEIHTPGPGSRNMPRMAIDKDGKVVAKDVDVK